MSNMTTGGTLHVKSCGCGVGWHDLIIPLWVKVNTLDSWEWTSLFIESSWFLQGGNPWLHACSSSVLPLNFRCTHPPVRTTLFKLLPKLYFPSPDFLNNVFLLTLLPLLSIFYYWQVIVNLVSLDSILKITTDGYAVRLSVQSQIFTEWNSALQGLWILCSLAQFQVSSHCSFHHSAATPQYLKDWTP